LEVCKLLKRWWPGTESNRRRQPFQGCALPARGFSATCGHQRKLLRDLFRDLFPLESLLSTDSLRVGRILYLDPARFLACLVDAPRHPPCPAPADPWYQSAKSRIVASYRMRCAGGKCSVP